MVRDKLEPYESRGSRTVLRGGGRRKASSLPDHPGSSPTPSSTDEETFARVFGRTDWALMFILASEGATYARLRFNTGPGGSLSLATAVDYSQPFSATDHEGWFAEYEACVHEDTRFFPMEEMLPSGATARAHELGAERPWLEDWIDPFYFDESFLPFTGETYDRTARSLRPPG